MIMVFVYILIVQKIVKNNETFLIIVQRMGHQQGSSNARIRSVLLCMFLPERTEIPPGSPPGEPKGPNILSALDEILTGMPGPADPEGSAAVPKSEPVAAKPPNPPGDEDMFRIPVDEESLPPPPGS